MAENPTPPAAAKQSEPAITAAQFAPTHAEQVPLAGLLAAKPDLVDAELTEAEWRKALHTYLKTWKVA